MKKTILQETAFWASSFSSSLLYLIRNMLLILLLTILNQSLADARTVTFAGREWHVKTGYGGPGSNYWSDSEQSVWVDGSGLHLKLRKEGSTWYCAEVESVEPTTYGMHRFYIDGRIDQLDHNICASPFLYANDNEEIDIEFRWDASHSTNSQYVVQPEPYTENVNIKHFNVTLNGTYSTHYIDWQSSYIFFKSFHGHYQEPPGSGYLINEWTYTGSNNPPDASNLKIHINIYLIPGSTSPINGQEVEFIITDADLPAPPLPTDVTPPAPNPMTWSTEPYETSTSSISMTATAATGSSIPIYYQFEFSGSPTGGSGGDGRDWDTSRTYTDSILETNHQYGYRVRARDSAPAQNTTGWSSVSYDYTDIETPSGATFGTITSTSIQVKSSNTPSGLTRGSSGLYIDSSYGTNSGWKQNNDFWTCSGLTPNYDCSFHIKARNGDGDETGYYASIWKYTLANEPGTLSFSEITTNSIQANWTSNGNYYDTDYFCENITTGQSSGWVNNTYSWNCTGLSIGTNYTFQVMARNKDGINSAWTYLGPIATLAVVPAPNQFSNVNCSNIQANWTANGNPEGTEYYCENITKGTNSGWITDTYWNSSNLALTTTYTFRVKARNGDGIETELTPENCTIAD